MSQSSISRTQSPTIQTDEQRDVVAQQKSPPEDAAGKLSKPHMSHAIDQDLFYEPAANIQPLQGAVQSSEAAAELQQDHRAAGDIELLPPPDFKPFFSLIADPATNEHYHPTVHYLFSDDDPEILTSAALASIESSERDPAAHGSAEDKEEGEGEEKEEEEEEEEEEGGIEERVVIIDIASDCKTVTNAVSLSKEWQALRTEVGAAPSMGEGGGGGGLMLKISGTEAARGGFGDVNGQKRARELDKLVEKFTDVLEGLGDVIGREEEATGEGGPEEGT